MGKQYKKLTNKDIEFIKKQKLFYLASSSGNEVNLSPKGYDSIRVIDENTIIFLSYSGSGNRTYNDAINDGEFTLVFNAYEGKPMILRLFCKAIIIDSTADNFSTYLELFSEDKNIVRNLFKFTVYAVESSCGESVPLMEYKEDRVSLKKWNIKMEKSGKLTKYNEDHLTPPDLHKL